MDTSRMPPNFMRGTQMVSRIPGVVFVSKAVSVVSNEEYFAHSEFLGIVFTEHRFKGCGNVT